MFVRAIKTKKRIFAVGKFCVQRIDINTETMLADCYTVGGNMFTVKATKILNDEKVVCNNRNFHKNLY